MALFSVRGRYVRLVVAMGLAFAGCGDDPAGPTQTGAVTVRDFEFDPENIVVAPGASVTWTWNGLEDHDVTFDSPSITDSPLQASGTVSTTTRARSAGPRAGSGIARAIATANASAVGGRSAGSHEAAPTTSSESAGGTSSHSEIGDTSFDPSHVARRIVRSSLRMIASANTSVRRSIGPPASCSGAM